MRAIIQKGDPVLKGVASDVPPEKIKTPKIQGIIKDMRDALSKEESGVAIAAPQIGEALRIFVVAGKIFKDPEDENAPIQPDLVFINPTIKKSSKKMEYVDEGCLSVRDIYGKVGRSTKITINAFNEMGEKFERGGSGLLAQIFQHEIDHLNGILFTDKAQQLYKNEQRDKKEK